MSPSDERWWAAWAVAAAVGMVGAWVPATALVSFTVWGATWGVLLVSWSESTWRRENPPPGFFEEE